MKKILFKIIFLSFYVFINNGIAQELVYTPINPSFGGNTFNFQWMLSEAQAQNTFTESSDFSRYNQDPLADFQDNLNRQILSRLSRQLIDNTFGEEQFTPGSYELGDYAIDVSEGSEGIIISIIDNLTGDETTVIVPYL